jgi:hypothetical protein
MNSSFNNESTQRRNVKSQLAREASFCQQYSMDVLQEFEGLDDDAVIE